VILLQSVQGLKSVPVPYLEALERPPSARSRVIRIVSHIRCARVPGSLPWPRRLGSGARWQASRLAAPTLLASPGLPYRLSLVPRCPPSFRAQSSSTYAMDPIWPDPATGTRTPRLLAPAREYLLWFTCAAIFKNPIVGELPSLISRRILECNKFAEPAS
jgi:hypothetical protein